MSEGARSTETNTTPAAGNVTGSAGSVPGNWSPSELSSIDNANKTLADTGSVNAPPSWTDKMVDVVKRYAEGASDKNSLGGFVGDFLNGNYAGAAGYVGNKVSSVPPPPPPKMVELPHNLPPEGDPMAEYKRHYAALAELYKQYANKPFGT